jgi:hypothetical protein
LGLKTKKVSKNSLQKQNHNPSPREQTAVGSFLESLIDASSAENHQKDRVQQSLALPRKNKGFKKPERSPHECRNSPRSSP